MSDIPIPPDRRSRSLAPLIISGVAAMVVAAWRSPVGAWLRGFLSEVPRPRPGNGTALMDTGLSPADLRDAIVGRGKSAIAALFGVPRTAAGAARPLNLGRHADFWSANTWYYPIDSRTRTAMAVHFQKGIARDVEFFDSPMGQAS